MSPLAQLLGSSTRAKIVEVLAQNKETKLSAYRISKLYNINMSKVYIEVKKLTKLNLLRAWKGKKGVEYSLEDLHLRDLAIRLSSSSSTFPRTISYDDWSEPKARAQRLRNGLLRVPQFSLGKKSEKIKSLVAKPTRMPGELDNLAVLARKRFDRKYEMKSAQQYVRV